MAEVLKREVLEGDSAADAKKKLARSAAKQLREKTAKAEATGAGVDEPNVEDDSTPGESTPTE